MATNNEFSHLSKEQFDAYVFWGINTEGVDLSDTNNRDRLLQNLLTHAFKLRLLNHGSTSYFDPTAGAVVVDVEVPQAQQLLNFKHEMAHLVASQNIFGRTLDAFSDLQDVLYKAYERPVLSAISYILGDMVEELYDVDAKQFKEEWAEKGEYAIALYYRHHLSKNQSRVAEVYNDSTFSSFRRIFLRVADRRNSLMRSWRLYQEGFATYKELHEFCDPMIAELAKQAFGLSQTDWDRIDGAANEARVRKLANLWRISTTYRKGFQVFQRLAECDEKIVFAACAFALASKLAATFKYASPT